MTTLKLVMVAGALALAGCSTAPVASGGKDDQVRLTPPKRATLEQAIAYIDDDEMVEVTPKSIRLRKRFLDANERKRASRAKQSA